MKTFTVMVRNVSTGSSSIVRHSGPRGEGTRVTSYTTGSVDADQAMQCNN